MDALCIPYPASYPLEIEEVQTSDGTALTPSPKREAPVSGASTDIKRNNNKAKDLLACAVDHIPPYDSPWWLYLMTVSAEEDEDEQANQKTLTHIGKSRQPVRCVELHNKRLVSSKLTQGAAGLWTIEMVIGPFPTKREVLPLQKLWKDTTRGPVTRREFGKWLATKLSVHCFDANFGNEDIYRDSWTQSRIERRRARRASKAASHNPAFLRRQQPKPLFCFSGKNTQFV